MGRANETVAGIQDQFVADATTIWLESLDRSLAMMKDYQVRTLGNVTSHDTQVRRPRSDHVAPLE